MCLKVFIRRYMDYLLVPDWTKFCHLYLREADQSTVLNKKADLINLLKLYVVSVAI